jgi:heme oxygenase
MTIAATHIEREPASRHAPRDILARLEYETAPEHSAIEAATGVMNPRLTGENWQTFRGALSRFAKTSALENEVIAGAKMTFGSFTRWLSRI